MNCRGDNRCVPGGKIGAVSHNLAPRCLFFLGLRRTTFCLHVSDRWNDSFAAAPPQLPGSVVRLMHIAHGTIKLTRRTGYIASRCTHCGRLVTAELGRLVRMDTAYGLPAGNEQTLGYYCQCLECSSVQAVDPTDYVTAVGDRTTPLPKLIEVTNPALSDPNCYEARWHERLTNLRRPFLRLETIFRERHLQRHSFDIFQSMAFLGLVVNIPTSIGLILKLMEWFPSVSVTAWSFGALAMLLLNVLWFGLTVSSADRRYFRKRYLTGLVEELRPHGVLQKELDELFRRFRLNRYHITKAIDARRLGEEVCLAGACASSESR